MKTNQLTGPALNWAVWSIEFKDAGKGDDDALLAALNPNYEPSTNWLQGGEIIERKKISLTVDDSGMWVAFNRYNYSGEDRFMQADVSPLVAAMRCYVASELGDSVDVPKELE